MSTRCALLVMEETTYGNARPTRDELLRCYRHCDGYPSGMGTDLADALARCSGPVGNTWAQSAIREILSIDANMEVEPHDTEHGDIEYLYVVTAHRHFCVGPSVAPDGITMAVYPAVGFDEPYAVTMSREPLYDGPCEGFDVVD